jgi:tetratricopeptide (TPR) repeat protein
VLSSVRLRSLLLRKEAAALSELGRYTEARPLFAQSDEIYTSIIAADPKDLRAKRDMRLLLTAELECEEHAADPALSQDGEDHRAAEMRAGEIADRKIMVVRQLLESKKDDADLKLELAATEVHRFVWQRELGGKERAVTEPTEALSLLRSTVRDPKVSPHNLELAFSAFRLLRTPSLRDTTFELRSAERGVELTHRKAADWLLALAQAYRDAGKTEEAGDAAKEGLALLPPPDADNEGFCRRKLLDNLEQSK